MKLTLERAREMLGEVIRRGAELLGLDLADAIAVCIEGMKPHAAETGLLPRPATAAAPVPPP